MFILFLIDISVLYQTFFLETEEKLILGYVGQRQMSGEVSRLGSKGKNHHNL